MKILGKKPSSLLWLFSLSLLLPINIGKHSSAFSISCCAFTNLRIGGRMCQTLLETFGLDFYRHGKSYKSVIYLNNLFLYENPPTK